MARRLDVIIFVVALLASFVAHVTLLEGLGSLARKAPRRTYRPMEIAVIKPPPPPKVEEKPEPKKEVPPPPPPEPIDIKKVVEAPPPPNVDNAPPSAEPPKPVFGVTMSSVVGPGSGSSFSVRVGNTLMKDPEGEFTKAEDVKAYSAKPVALHKVNKMPAKQGDCQADYPPEAKTMGIEGAVRLEVEVRADGTVGNVRMLKGIGYGLDEAAVAALKKCRFSPAIMGGSPVATKIPYTYRFVIED